MNPWKTPKDRTCSRGGGGFPKTEKRPSSAKAPTSTKGQQGCVSNKLTNVSREKLSPRNWSSKHGDFERRAMNSTHCFFRKLIAGARGLSGNSESSSLFSIWPIPAKFIARSRAVKLAHWESRSGIAKLDFLALANSSVMSKNEHPGSQDCKANKHVWTRVKLSGLLPVILS
jgi:hypothetical protein